LETAIYRIVQEALTNAIKHGKARRAVIEIHELGAELLLRVRDDGNGFDPQADTSGFGLLGMRERVQLLEGSFEIESSPSGTTISARLPVRRRAERSASASAVVTDGATDVERTADSRGANVDGAVRANGSPS
jgi:signal transduction histidine kinase